MYSKLVRENGAVYIKQMNAFLHILQLLCTSNRCKIFANKTVHKMNVGGVLVAEKARLDKTEMYKTKTLSEIIIYI